MTLGILFSIATAVLWAISPLCFASAGRRVGAFPVAVVRILLAAVVLLFIFPLYVQLARIDFALPTREQFLWIATSSAAGIAVGDILIYESLVRIGPRRTTLLYPLQPVAAVLTAWVTIGEKLSGATLAGVLIVIAATAYVVLARNPAPGSEPNRDGDAPQRSEPGTPSAFGYACGIGGSVLGGLGAVALRQSYRSPGPALDPFVVTVLRVVTATALCWIVPVVRGNVRETLAILKHPEARPRILAGTIVGPVMGMVCYTTALKFAPAGLVSTLTSTSPLIVLPYVVVWYRARVSWTVPVAAVVACLGVAIICNPALVEDLLRNLQFPQPR